MRTNNLLLYSFVLTLFIFFGGCKTESDQIVTSKDGVRISFDKQGMGKPAIIFVHGWTNNRSVWDTQVDHFSEKYTTVAVDLAGHGQSCV